MNSKVGVVVIGRNEGLRLRRCLESLTDSLSNTVYVDSGSADGSIHVARQFGATALSLDMCVPFCAARARNEGYQCLLNTNPQTQFVQFIDADCEIVPGWMSAALGILEQRNDVAIVAGRLRERNPDVSIYNRIGELEWNAALPGEVDSVGGIFMVRCKAFGDVAGFDPSIAAGEEPELCQRLLRNSWYILRLDREMATHDLAMTKFSQWWKRMMRAGYGSMDVARRFRIARFVRNNRRVLFWGIWLAATVSLGIGVFMTLSKVMILTITVLLLVLPAQIIRIALRARRNGHNWNVAGPYAVLMGISFVPQALGQLRYMLDRLQKKSYRVIEYKIPEKLI